MAFKSKEKKGYLQTSNYKKDSNSGLLLGVTVYILATLFVFLNASYATTLLTIPEGAEWRYFKGDKVPSAWNRMNFDDSGWLVGPSGFGYGDTAYNTLLDDMQGNYKGIYVRKSFNIRNPSHIKKMAITMVCSGTFEIYLNGEGVLRSGPIKGILTPIELDISGFIDAVRTGKNVLAIKCESLDIASDSFIFLPVFVIEK